MLSLGGSGQIAQAGESDKVTAKAHYEKGTRLYEIREYDKSLLEYKAAYLAQPDPAFLFNIGQCYRKLGQNQEALSFFEEYLKKASPDDPNRHQVEARVRDIEAGAKLKAEAAQTVPPPSTPNPEPNLPLPAPTPIPAQATPPAPLPAPELAPLTPTPATPVVTAPPPPATPVLPATATSVEQTAQASTAPQPTNPGLGLRIGGIACGVAGLASVGTAIYYYTRARSLSDRVTNSQTPTASDDQAGKDAQTMQWVFYGVGAAALVAGTVLYWLGSPSTNTGQTLAGVAPMVGPGLAGISAQGAF
ncbi:MAG TPA: tetratricopeptide repeat protein [Polyangia bacterium]|nr:tetratricopeptide repeat protein [Polyangia bacterium]